MRNTAFLSKLTVFVLFFVIGTTVLLAQTPTYETVTVDGQTYYKYRVQPGEGLYAISRTFSVTVAEILRHNPDANSGLKSGQQLLIPVQRNVNNTPQSVSPQSTIVDQNNTFKHTVSRGETVFAISQMYNTTVDEIFRLNPQSREGIGEGQVLTIPQRRIISEVKEENYRYHTILPKETLYSVSKTYSLRPEDVIRANPGLSVETFQIGKTIRIPFFESNETIIPYQNQIVNITHVVKRGETLYSIARGYKVSVEDIERANPMLSGKLKTNMELLVPVKRTQLEADNARSAENEANRLLSTTKVSQRLNVLKVGLLLPFLDETGKGHLRLQEFYEGFAMALLKMKNEGTDIEFYVFEIGKGNDTRKLESLLTTLEMQSLNLIVGGANDAQIKVISDFSKAYNVKYVVPFSLSNNEVLNNFNIFQVNPPQSNTYIKVSDLFVETYRNSNIVFVTGGRNDKTDFVNQLQSELRRKNMKYQTISATSTLNTAIVSLLSSGRENVIVPTTGDAETLQQIIDELKKVKEANSAYNIRLFGYPEWKTFSTNLTKEYHSFDTYIFTTFYSDDNDSEVKLFDENFRKWYGRGMMDLYPRYAMWGYDTGLYFMTALKQYGSNFEQNINRVNVRTLQHGFTFERANNWGGFVNTTLYLVRYTPNGTVLKFDKSR